MAGRSQARTTLAEDERGAVRELTPELARRLAITRQRLAGPRPPADPAGILEVVRDLGCLQLDPTSAVARSHLLVLWSRLGPFDPAHLDTLLWDERRLFEYWAHAASIVLAEDYPIHQLMMRRYAAGDSPWDRRVREWMDTNAALRAHIREALQAGGPLPTNAFADQATQGWRSSGWTAGRNVDRMLDFLWTQGVILIAGRQAGRRFWDLAARRLPEYVGGPEWPEREVVRQAVQKALRALGVARVPHIEQHYTRGRYPGLEDVLAELEAAGQVVRVCLAAAGPAGRGPWYMHAADLPLLDDLAAGAWAPRTTLLSPFDNLICDRARTETLFDFRFRLEIYVPAAQRQYGYFVLPILHGDRLIGRLDPRLDRKQARLHINAVYAEPDAPLTAATGRAVGAAVADLATFLGAREIVYEERVPAEWRAGLVDAAGG